MVEEFMRFALFFPGQGAQSVGMGKDFYEAHDMLFMPVLRLIKLALPKMQNEEFGRIINITSVSVKEPNEDLLLSNIYRVGIVSMAKTISKEIVIKRLTE